MSMSSSSAILGVRLSSVRVGPPPPPPPQRVTIECSSRPQKKATKHHMKTRPRKTNPSDRRHGPPVYPPLPPLPSEWTLIIPSTSHSHDHDDNNPSSAQPHQSQ